MKRIFLVFLVIFIQFSITYPQNRPSITKRSFTIYGIILSLKGGINSGDKYFNDNTINYINTDIPPGGAAEVSLEYPLGKNFYAGANVTGWFSKDKFFDNYLSVDVTRKVFGFNFCAYAKYRWLIRRTSLNISSGLGRSLIVTKFSEAGHNSNIDANNFSASIGVDHFFGNGLLLSFEGSYYFLFGGFDASGNDRSNQMLLGKLGIGYVFPLKRRI
jgi:hypothetical protein